MSEAYPLQWPDGWRRATERRKSPFKVSSFVRARDQVLRELRLMGAAHAVISTNVELRLDGLPCWGRRQPEDPGVAVYWLDVDNQQRCIACDSWLKVEDNARAIALSLEAMRGLDRWGSSELVERAFRGFQSLPPAGDDWRWVLGLDRGTRYTSEDVKARYRELARRAHPDRGGNPAEMVRLNQAWEAAQRVLGGQA